MSSRPPLTYTDLRFEARLESPDHALQYLGPTLRGAFGIVMKRTVCQVDHGRCERCLLRQACPYPAVFEGRPPTHTDVMRNASAVPQPFVLDVAAPETWDGEDPQVLRWGIRLFGQASLWSPYVIESFLRVGARGIGRRRVPFELLSVRDGVSNQEVWRRGEVVLRSPEPASVCVDPPPRDGVLRWTLVTPMHLREGGEQAGKVDGLGLVLAGRRRWGMLSRLFGHAETVEPAAADRLAPQDFQTVERDLYPWSIQRFSGRQRRKLALSGVLGSLSIRGPWSRAGEWIRAVHRTHIGKYATFGFGRVQWTQE